METQSNTLQWKELKFALPWGHVAAKAWGHATDKRVLLVHGIQDNAGSYDRLIRLLPETFYYVCIDLPGHGLSSHFPPGIPSDFFAYVYAVFLVLEALQWEKCIYMGHSFGSMIGVMLSVLYPTRWERLICIDGIIPKPIPNNKLLSYVRDTYDVTSKSFNATRRYLYSKEEVLHTLMCKRHSALNMGAATALFERAVKKVDNMYEYNRDPRTRIPIKPTLNIGQYTEVVKNINIPVLIIVASSGLPPNILTDVLETIETLKLRFPSMDLHVVEGNHDVHNNNPERVALYICKALAQSIESKL